MKRFLLFLVVVVAGGVAALALTVPATAASVNGTTISQSELTGQLSTISGSRDVQCLLTAQEAVRSDGEEQLPAVDGAGGGTVSTTFAGYWLGQDISAEVADQLAGERGVSPSPVEVAAARKDLVSSYESALQDVEGSSYQCTTAPAEFVAALPGSFMDAQVRLESTTEALLANSATGVSPRAIAAYYASHLSDFDTLCVSGIEVSSESTATKLRSQILAGTPFATVAEKSSLDTTSAADGGALGCFSPTSSEYASLAQNVSGLALDTPSKPVSNGEGDYLLFTVTKRTPAPLSTVHSLVRDAVLSARETRVNSLLTSAIRHSDISVDPRYGHWTAASATTGLQAPLAPPVGSVLNASANSPSSSTSSAGSSATGSSTTGSSATGSSATGSAAAG